MDKKKGISNNDVQDFKNLKRALGENVESAVDLEKEEIKNQQD